MNVLLQIYIVSALFVFIIAIKELFTDIRADYKKRSDTWYQPTVRVRNILIWMLAVITPGFNTGHSIVYLVFNIVPNLYEKLWYFIDLPLVPRKKN